MPSGGPSPMGHFCAPAASTRAEKCLRSRRSRSYEATAPRDAGSTHLVVRRSAQKLRAVHGDVAPLTPAPAILPTIKTIRSDGYDKAKDVTVRTVSQGTIVKESERARRILRYILQ